MLITSDLIWKSVVYVLLYWGRLVLNWTLGQMDMTLEGDLREEGKKHVKNQILLLRFRSIT